MSCYLYDRCNHTDCDTFCMRKYKMDFLYEQSLLTEKQREKISLYIDNDGSDLEAFENLKSIQDNILDFVNKGDNLYIHSHICGNGKTSWAIRLLQVYLDKIWVKSPLVCRVLFIHVPKFLLALKDDISVKSEYIKQIKDNVLDADLVVWDEVGVKSLTNFEHENILNLINARINSGKSNIYTSNLSNEELHVAVGDRLYSRIVNYSLEIELKGADKRKL